MRRINKIYKLAYIEYILLISFLIILTRFSQAQAISEWQFRSQRDEIAPFYKIDKNLLYMGEPTLLLSGGGKDYCNGNWYKEEIVEPGKYFDFSIHFKAKEVEETHRCILARILWKDQEDNPVGRAEYPMTSLTPDSEGWRSIKHTYMIPENTTTAEIELVYRWDADGRVNFGGYSFMEVPAPPPQTVRLATVHYRVKESPGVKYNLNEYEKYIRIAANKDADIICLPEGITIVGTLFSYVEVSESIPGRTTEFLGKLAKELGVYIVAGIYERSGEVVYNTSVLIDRSGNLAGKYRKLSLPREEIQGGITPGDKIPVFDTDFGRIGMMICWDVTFPETARALGMQGAQVIFIPIWGGNLTLTKARAIENQVFLVTSSYDMKSAVFNKEGEIIAEATDENRVAIAEVDLAMQKLWPWLGDMKNRIPREMPSEMILDQSGK